MALHGVFCTLAPSRSLWNFAGVGLVLHLCRYGNLNIMHGAQKWMYQLFEVEDGEESRQKGEQKAEGRRKDREGERGKRESLGDGWSSRCGGYLIWGLPF